MISTLTAHLYGSLATFQKSRFVIQSLNNCSLLQRENAEVIHPFFIFCLKIFMHKSYY